VGLLIWKLEQRIKIERLREKLHITGPLRYATMENPIGFSLQTKKFLED
jgi:hypothetical protein